MPKGGTTLEDLSQVLTVRERVLLEIFREQEKKIAENISDWTIPFKGKRILTLKVVYESDEGRRILECEIVPELKLVNRHSKAIEQVRLNQTSQEIFEVSEKQEPLPMERAA